eukprot:gnl/Spiro4/25437_TR12688_c0_g1_i1.p2 gnl/Spiro4/25437_TR12688_c0_g1~~gnl/Spiro4/25437_TR12688_c0_g1_i1.p2  ORF type:complete len:109 (-),score=3.45 gnl/Spiro4/25437_TR12688_c0_g1_i1:267-593(-)
MYQQPPAGLPQQHAANPFPPHPSNFPSHFPHPQQSQQPQSPHGPPGMMLPPMFRPPQPLQPTQPAAPSFQYNPVAPFQERKFSSKCKLFVKNMVPTITEGNFYIYAIL